MVRRNFTIVNEKGLHARAAAHFAACAEGFEARCTVRRDGMDASGESIMGLLMLAAACGTIIEVEAEGPDAEDLLDALAKLIANRFGERM